MLLVNASVSDHVVNSQATWACCVLCRAEVGPLTEERLGQGPNCRIILTPQ